MEFCFQGVDKGSGEAKQARWHYDHEDGVCKVIVSFNDCLVNYANNSTGYSAFCTLRSKSF